MTKPKTAILWGHDDVLTQAMERLLLNEDAWEVIRMPAGQSIHTLVEKVQDVKPELVIFYQAKRDEDSDPLVKLMEEEPELKAIADQPDLKVITVSLENNVMQLYRKRSITIRRTSDLLSIIEDRYFLDHPAQKEVSIGKTD